MMGRPPSSLGINHTVPSKTSPRMNPNTNAWNRIRYGLYAPVYDLVAPGDVRYFDEADLDEAWVWVREDASSSAT